MPAGRRIGLSLVVGILHAVGLLVVAIDLGYSVGPAAYSPVELLWRYGGLVLVAAVPVWLALRYRLVTPLAAMVLTAGYVLGMELLAPGPTFRDVAELEGFAEPTGIVVVENGLYIVRYMLNASVWTVGFLIAGLVEYAVRTSWDSVPSIRRPVPWLSIPETRRRAALVATGGGLLHAAVMVGFAYRLGLSGAGANEWLVYAYGTVGMWLLAALPLYLLVRHRLVGSAALLTVFVLNDVWTDFTAGVDDPHALYFGAWFAFLAVLLVVSGIEFGLRRVGGVRAQWSSS